MLDSQNLTARELYGFCQPPESDIEVIPPFDDLLAYTQEDAANPVEDNDEQLQEENAMQSNDMVTDNTLDGAYTDADRGVIAATNQLIKYFRDFIASDFDKAKVPASIYGWTATGQVMDKEGAKRRLRELIDVAINRKAGIEDITPKQKQRLIDYQHDARVISDYLTNRIRHTGARNLLRTPEMKAKFPEIDNQPRDEFDSAIASDEVMNIVYVTLDSISGFEKIKLIKEVSGIRSNLQTVQSGLEKLKLIKRIKEIRAALEVDNTPEPEVSQQNTIADVNAVMPLLKQFIGKSQLSAIGSAIRGEESQFFKDKLIEIANVIQTMPKTYGQDGMGDKAIAYLHYFKGSGDWHITERDMENEQLQAFGLANLGYGGELGYISIQELIGAGVELDLHWTPKTIEAIRISGDKPKTTDEQSQINQIGDVSDTQEKSIMVESEFKEKLEKFGELYMRLRKLKGLEDGNPDVVLRYRIDDLFNELKGYAKTGGSEYALAQLNDEILILQEAIGKYGEDKTQNNETGNESVDPAIPVNGDKLFVEQEVRARGEQIKDEFIAKLETLKSETDINRFNDRLDEIAARIEQAGLMEFLDKELNDAADVLTRLLSEAEKGG